MTDPTEAGLREIAALRRRLANLEALARQQAQSPPTDKPAGFSDAIRAMRAQGTASGSAIDSLRQQITGRPPALESPSPADLADATRSATDFGARPTIEGAFTAMQNRAARVDVVGGALGRVDPLDGTTARAIDKIRKLFDEEH